MLTHGLTALPLNHMVNQKALKLPNKGIPYLLEYAALINSSRHKCSAYSGAAFILGRHLFKNCARQIYFFYIFIQRYTFYLLIFLWTDTKLIVNLELRKKFTRWKKPESFMITRAKLSAVRVNSFVVVEQFTTFCQFWCHCLRIKGAVLIWWRHLLTFLSQMWRLFEGGAYLSKYGIEESVLITAEFIKTNLCGKWRQC